MSIIPCEQNKSLKNPIDDFAEVRSPEHITAEPMG